MALYVVATPIGNLSDLSDRARSVLGAVDVIACEDTRRTLTLVTHLGLQVELLSCHEHNEQRRVRELLERLRAGDDVALVSDAGTPLISDPGFPLVRAARAEDIEVIAVPGPSSVIAALSVAGLPTDRFWFEGFLPVGGRRTDRLTFLATLGSTAVLLESPRRLRQTIRDLQAACGSERQLCIARELTKRFEQVTTDSLERQLARVEAGEVPERGEVVLVLEGGVERSRTDIDADQLLQALLEELAPAAAARVASRSTGLPRRELYARAQEMKKT